jgi:ribosomal protein S18 acetylase RimI-like enzyme
MESTEQMRKTRWMIRRDYPMASYISRMCFLEPIEVEDFETLSHVKGQTAMVVTEGDETLGFMVYTLNKGEIDLLALAVLPWYAEQGVGTQLIETLKGRLLNGREEITTLVRESSLGAQLFLQKVGFVATGVCDDHPVEPAIKMTYRKSKHD